LRYAQSTQTSQLLWAISRAVVSESLHVWWPWYEVFLWRLYPIVEVASEYKAEDPRWPRLPFVLYATQTRQWRENNALHSIIHTYYISSERLPFSQPTHRSARRLLGPARWKVSSSPEERSSCWREDANAGARRVERTREAWRSRLLVREMAAQLGTGRSCIIGAAVGGADCVDGDAIGHGLRGVLRAGDRGLCYGLRFWLWTCADDLSPVLRLWAWDIEDRTLEGRTVTISFDQLERSLRSVSLEDSLKTRAACIKAFFVKKYVYSLEQ
jgi:hypothetical protein